MTRWHEENKEDIRKYLNKLCKERNINFIGFDVPWKAGYTKLILHCPVHGEWRSTNLTNFVSLGYGCERCNRSKSIDKYRISDEDMKEHFKKLPNLDSLTFERDLSYKSKQSTYNRFKVYCKICADDEYSKAGVGPSFFFSTISHLKQGKVPCRCSKSYRWKEDELLYQIDKMAEVKNLQVKEIKRNAKGKLVKSCRLKYTCKKSHEVETSVSKFLIASRGCAECKKLCYGFYPTRAQDLDYLYVLSFERFLKVGRSFDLKSRMKDFKNKSEEGFEVKNVFSGIHKDIYELEQEILDRYKEPYVTWTTETVSIQKEPLVYQLIDENKGKVTQVSPEEVIEILS